MIAWSWSRLQDSERCLSMFHHKHILKDVKFFENAAMKRGKSYHKELERAVKTAARGGTPQIKIPELLPVLPIIEAINTSHETVLAERQLAFTKKHTACDWFDKQTWFRAVLDVVGFKDNVASVIDWKTGKLNVVEEQCELFAVATMLKWPEIDHVDTSLVFVDHQWASPVIRYSRPEVADLLHFYEEQAEKIQIAEETNEWPATQNRLCKWCPCTPAQCKYKPVGSG